MFFKNANYAQCACEPQNGTEINFWRSFVLLLLLLLLLILLSSAHIQVSNTTVNCFCLLSSAPEKGLFHLHCNWLMSYCSVIHQKSKTWLSTINGGTDNLINIVHDDDDDNTYIWKCLAYCASQQKRADRAEYWEHFLCVLSTVCVC